MAKVIHGGGASDQLIVTADKTQAYGLSGNDTIISGGNSSVLLIGGSGDDNLVMMGGIGTLNGGAGKDTFELTYSADKKLSAMIEDFEPSTDKIIVNRVGNTAPQLTSSSLSNGDVVWKDSDGLFNLTLKSVRENDYFDGDAPEQIWEVLERTNNERETPTLPEAPNRSEYSDESEYKKAYQKYLDEKDDQETLVADARTKDLSWLTLSEGLMIGAVSRAVEIKGLDEMGALSNHKRPDGSNYSTMIVDVEKNLSLSAKYSTFGENLDAGAKTPEKVLSDWVGSFSHHENILDAKKSFTKLGVGYVHGESSAHDHYWTQLFGGSSTSSEKVTVKTSELLKATIQTDAVTKTVTGTNAANTLENSDYYATINARGGDDLITNTGALVSIAGGSGADTIDNSGINTTINAGTGDDSISIGFDARNNLIQYKPGDGNDIIRGFRADSTLSISGDKEYSPETVGNDVVIEIGSDSITLAGAAKLSTLQIDGKRSKLYKGNEDANTINNSLDSATINARGGDDLIKNNGAKLQSTLAKAMIILTTTVLAFMSTAARATITLTTKAQTSR